MREWAFRKGTRRRLGASVCGGGLCTSRGYTLSTLSLDSPLTISRRIRFHRRQRQQAQGGGFFFSRIRRISREAFAGLQKILHYEASWEKWHQHFKWDYVNFHWCLRIFVEKLWIHSSLGFAAAIFKKGFVNKKNFFFFSTSRFNRIESAFVTGRD